MAVNSLTSKLCNFALFHSVKSVSAARGLTSTPFVKAKVFKASNVDMKKLQPKTMDESGEVAQNVDVLAQADKLYENFEIFPDETTADTLYNGIKYKDLPYVIIKCTKNNTRFAAFKADGTDLAYTTPVLNGFVHAKKRTNVAAQVTGLAMGQKLRQLNHKTVRIRIDGFNVGRVAAITGITQAGIQIISISDVTHIDWTWTKRPQKRPRK